MPPNREFKVSIQCNESWKIVGIKITNQKDSITISQSLYINSILQKYRMENTNSASTLLDPNVKLKSNTEQRKANHSNDYALLIGFLHYLTIATHPDIAYAINWLVAYTANPSFNHYNAVKPVEIYQINSKL